MRLLVAFFAAFTAFARAEQVVFSEIMYHPVPGKPEYIEVQNITNTPLDIADWKFTDGVDYTFPPYAAGAPQAHFLQAMERVVLSSADAATTRAAYPGIPASVRIFGPWIGALANEGERITLEDKNGVPICTVEYGDGGRWPKAADGAGHSIVLRNENTAIDDSRNWRQSKFAHGTPGSSEFATVEPYPGNPETGAGASAVMFDYGAEWKHFTPPSDPGTGWQQRIFDDSGWGSGPGLLGFETTPLPAPGLQTPVGSQGASMVYLFRKSFTFSGNPAGVTFSIDQVVDDGVYYYLNGQPLGGMRYTPGQWDGAAGLVPEAVEEIDAVSGAATGLINGVNVLSAEVHQNTPGSSDMVFGARLKLNTPSNVVINEVKPGGSGAGFVEFFNLTGAPIDLNGHYLSDTSANLTKFQITSALVVPANSFATVGFAEAGLAANGETVTVYLTAPNGTVVVNGFSAPLPQDGRSMGRSPDGSAAWSRFVFVSPGGPNGGVADQSAAVRLSEAHFSAMGSIDWVELENTATVPINVAGLWVASKADFSDKVPLTGSIAPGSFASWSTNFLSDAGDVTLYLVDSSHNVRGVAELERVPGRDSMQAAYPAPVRTKPAWQHISEAPWWHSSPAHTRDAANAPPINTSIVINEIMADPPSDHVNAEFIELHNKTGVPVSLAGWRIRGGVDFDFAAGTSVPPGGFLVVGADRAFLRSAYAGATVVGDWSGKLSNRGDLIRLIDNFGNLADEVDYRIGGDWPDLAAGLGSSLELAHPDLDNSRASAWRDSNEANKAPFQSYTVTGTWSQLNTSGGDSDHKELHLFLVGDSHVALRNMVFRPTSSGGNLLPNAGTVVSTDGTGVSGWLCQGTHGASFGQSGELRLVADGHGDNRPNRAEIDVLGLAQGTNYTFTFEARWVAGKNRLVVQTWDHSFGAPILLPIPQNLGTAGAPNSQLTASPPPQVDSVLHSPAVPRATDAVKVTARVASVAPLSAVQCVHRVDDASNANPWMTTPMVDDGTNGDAVASDGLFTATIADHQTNGRIVQFYVRATAQGGATRDLPKLGELRPAVWLVDNSTVSAALRRQRFIVPQYDRNIFNTGGDLPSAQYGYRYPRLSNHYVNCTFIHNEQDVYYNAEIRKSGSPWTRSGGADLTRGKWKVPRDRMFRGREKSTYDNDAAGGSRHHNRLIRYWLYLFGHPVNENEFVHNMINTDGVQIREDTEPVDGELVARVFPEGGKGQLFRSDDQWWFTDDWNRSAQSADWSYKGTDAAVRYHSEWMMRSREAEYDHSALIDLFRNVNATGADYEARMNRILDPQLTLMMAAARGYAQDWDSLTLDRGKNGYFYRKPTDGRFMFMHWDSDLAFGSPSGSVVGGLPGWGTYVNQPWTRRILNYYLARMLDLTTGSDGARTLAWLDAEEASSSAYTVNRSGYETFFANRQARVEQEINNAGEAYNAPFVVSTPSGTTASGTLNISGTAPAGAFTIVVDGHPEAVFTWLSQTQWTLSGIILKQGVNVLTLRMLDHAGNLVGTPLTYNFTKTGNALPAMAMSVDPASLNVALGEPVTLDVAGSYDPDGTALSFAWTVPSANVSITSPSPSRRVARFNRPGRYVFTVVGTDGAGLASSITREVTVFNTADFESFGERLLRPFWTMQNLELRDSFSASAWYSIEDEPGRLLLQTLDNAAKPLVFNSPAFPWLIRPLPSTGDFILQTDLGYHTKRTGSHYAGLQIETVENGAPVRYALGLENGLNVVVKRGTTTIPFSNLGASPALNATDLVIRIRRVGTQLFFERRLNQVWSGLHTANLGANPTTVRGGPFVATTVAENLRIAFDYVLLADVANDSSALTSARITEVMYGPKAPDTVEFIELRNFGNGPVNLQNCRFPDGDPFDEFVFPDLTLAPGAYAVVTNNTAAFRARYGNGPTVAGEWGTSSALNNGELVILLDPEDNEIHRFTYGNTAPWPVAADGRGPSMEVVDVLGNYNAGSNWRASFEIGGSPGEEGAGPDADGDGQPDRWEALFGTDPNSGASRFAASVSSQGGGGSQISFPSVSGRSYRVDYCDDLTSQVWTPLQTIVASGASTSVSDTTVPKPAQRFYRVTPL